MRFAGLMVVAGCLIWLGTGCSSVGPDPYFMDTDTTANVYVRQMPAELRKVAVMPFKAPTELIGSSVSDLFVTEVLRSRYYTLVERSQMGKVLSEAELSASGVSENRAMEIGNMLGADCVLIGTVDEYSLVAQKSRTYAVVGISIRLIDCTSGKVIWSADLASRADNQDITLPQHARSVVHEITAALYKEWVEQTDVNKRANDLDAVLPGKGRPAAAAVGGAQTPEPETRLAPVDEPPQPPPDLTVSDMGLREVAVSWSAVVNADKYLLERATSPDGPYEVVYTGGKTSYTDRGQHNSIPLADATTYYYRTTAVSATGKKSNSTAAKESMTALPPEEVTGVMVFSDMVRCVPITWNRLSDANITGYEILRSKSPDGPFEKIAFVKGGASTNFTDGGSEPGSLDDNAKYHYRVLAVNRVTAKSIKATDVTAVTRAAPPVVTGLAADGGHPREVPLTWKMSADDKVAGYVIQRADADSDKFCDLEDLEGLEVNSYRDRDGVSVSKKLAGLKDNTAYKYRILAYNIADVRSPWSEPVSAVTKPAPSKPEIPEAISGIARAIELQWKPCPEKDIAEYVLEYRGKDSGKFKEIIRTAATIHNHSGLDDGSTYIYRIKAIDKDLLESVYSDEAMATTKPLPGTPKDLTAEADSAGGFKIKWLAPPQKDIASYKLYKSGLFSRKLLKETAATECVVEESVVGKSAKVSVSAVDRDGLESVLSPAIEIKPSAK